MNKVCARAYLWAWRAAALDAWQQLAVEQLRHSVLHPLQDSAFAS